MRALQSTLSRAVNTTRTQMSRSTLVSSMMSTRHHSTIGRPSHINNSIYPHDSANTEFVLALLHHRKPGYGLVQDFYQHPAVYNQDLKHVWKKSWLFAGYECQIPSPGEYFTYEVDKDCLIIMRGDDGIVRAMYNSCRHRGSRVCETTHTTCKTKRLVCPYHQWSYDRDGTLAYARDMPADFKKEDNGLHRAHCEVVDGMIFINLAPFQDAPPFEFEPARQLISSQIKHHGLKNAKIIHTDHHIIHANWKLVYENNRECYHCAGGHPEYVAANYDLAFSYTTDKDGHIIRTVDPSHPRKEELEQYMAEKTKYWGSLGVECTPDNQFPGAGWYRASRQPLKKGWLVESIDGQPVSKKIMGTLPNHDMGSLRIHCLPNYWIHASSDHAVSTRLTPIDVNTTAARVDWLVHADAVEGKDYDLSKVLPFWQVTNAQDWRLCEVNAQGVASSVYQPGRYSEKKEKGLERFVNWYANLVETGIHSKQ